MKLFSILILFLKVSNPSFTRLAEGSLSKDLYLVPHLIGRALMIPLATKHRYKK